MRFTAFAVIGSLLLLFTALSPAAPAPLAHADNPVARTEHVVPGGKLEMGTAEHPVANGTHARLIFADGGPIDTIRDPMIMGRGLISHGSVRICGAEVTSWASLAIGGAIVPSGACTDARIHALVSTPTAPADDVRLSAVRTTQLQGAHLACYQTGNKQSLPMPAVDLLAGWNLITRVIAEHKRSFLVFGGDTDGGDKKYTDKKGKY